MRLFSHLKQQRIRGYESGQALILIMLLLFLVSSAAVGAIDYGNFMKERQKLEIALDAAVLAGGLELPTSGTTATSMALQYINKNDPDSNVYDVTTSFRCLVGDRNNDGIPDAADIPVVCDPGEGADFECADGLCISPCEFVGNNTCNTMAVTASKDVQLIFTRLLGLSPVMVTASRTGACKGLCGEPPAVPLDVIIVLDRTTSMSVSDLEDAKDGAKAVLELFNPEMQHVGLAVINAGNTDDPKFCTDNYNGKGGDWLVVPLSNDYQNADGSLNESSELVSTIKDFQRCHYNDAQTNLGSPLSDSAFNQHDALTELLDSGRDVKKGIILMTDGAANQPYSGTSSLYANQMASIVKGNDIEIFTIGYGIEGEYCRDTSGPYKATWFWWWLIDGVRVTTLLADMATNSLDEHGHCLTPDAINAENTDGDHFMCVPKGGDLELVFTAAAAALSTDIKLIIYPEE